MLDIIQWLIEIEALDARRMSPLTLCLCVLLYGGLGLLFTVLASIRLLQGSSGGATLGLLLLFLLGAAVLTRLGYGIFCRWRGAGTNSTQGTEC